MESAAETCFRVAAASAAFSCSPLRRCPTPNLALQAVVHLVGQA